MPDYHLGRAHGDVSIGYDGSGARRAQDDLDRLGKKAAQAGESSEKMRRSMEGSEKQMRDSGDAARGFSSRLREVHEASRNVRLTEEEYKRTLLDSESSVEKITEAQNRHNRALKDHESAVKRARDAHRAFKDDLDRSGNSSRSMSNAVTHADNAIRQISRTSDSATDKVRGLGSAVGMATKVLAVLGPQGRAASIALGLLSGELSKTGAGASSAGGMITGFVKSLASFEMAIVKASAVTLGGGALAGLVGGAGAASVKGIVSMAGAVKQLSGALGLLPASMAAVVFQAGTLMVAFNGVGDALTDMMDKDPKKFLEDLQDMGPVAARSMLEVAKFRDAFRAAGGVVQDSFFSKIIQDIQPLIQTWLPAIAGQASRVSGAFGEMAHIFAQAMMNPQQMEMFSHFVDNLIAGLNALKPAITPIVSSLGRLAEVGSGFFVQIGDAVSRFAERFANMIEAASADGRLESWIQTAINAFGHLMTIGEQFGSAFVNIMTIADKFGGGGLLGWLDKLMTEFNRWTESAQGQQAIADFFSLMNTATEAFLPILGPMTEALGGLAKAFVMLGIGTSPGWVAFFKSFSDAMIQLGPQLMASAPAINQALTALGSTFAQLVATIGPKLPEIFMALSNAFIAILPQLPTLANLFAQLIISVGPSLPGLFDAITSALEAMEPLWPAIVEAIRLFAETVTVAVGALQLGIEVMTKINDLLGKDLPHAIQAGADIIGSFFGGLADKALEWGKNLVINLAKGITDGGPLGMVNRAAQSVVGGIAEWFQHSPAKRGPFSGSGYTMVRGQQMIKDMATGMLSAQSSVSVAAAATATNAAQGLSGGGGGARAPLANGLESAGGALLPDHIASADVSILDRYLDWEPSERRGLKGLAADLGKGLSLMQGAFNLIYQQGIQQVMAGMALMPGADRPSWRKMTQEEMAKKSYEDLMRKTGRQGPGWGDVMGGGAGGSSDMAQHMNAPLNVTASSSKEDIQQAIIAGGRQRGLSDEAIQTALAVAAAESGFNPTISGGVQGSAGLVSGLFQQSPSAGWGTLDQVNDPSYAINKFYEAFTKQLASNPSNPLLAAVLTQNPQLGSGALGSQYARDVQNQLGLAKSILGSSAPKTWDQVGAGSGGIATPPPAIPGGGAVGLNPASRASQVPNAPNVEAGIKSMGGMPTLYPTSGPGAYQVPAWAQNLAQMFGLTASTYASGGSLHEMGYAFDFNDPDAPNGPSARKEAFANFIQSQLMGQTLQLIYRGQRDYGIASGQNVGGGYYAGDLPGHTDHVHWATDVPPSMDGSGASPGAGGIAGALGVNGNLMLPSGRSLDQLIDNTGKTLTVNDQLLQAYLQGNPELAAQIGAAQMPGASQDQVTGALGGIDKTISDLKLQDAIGNQGIIQGLQSTQSRIAEGAGFQQTANPLQVAQQIGGAASGAIGSVIQAIQGGLDAMAATQDIADRLVYGVRNTEDVMKIVDDVQKYITFASNLASAAGSILSMAGSMSGGADMGATSGAGQMAQLLAGVLQGVNAAIDFGQQVYRIAGSYAGKLLSNLVAGAGGTPLMGNVRFLLNKNTGELLSYSQDNPGNQNVLPGMDFINALYGYGKYGKGGNENPQVSQQLNVYAGPGQSSSEMMREVVWMVNSSNNGAAQPQNF